MGKVVKEAELVRLREELRSVGKRVGFTNGCFDLLHVGHVRYLGEAREAVDALVVGLNSDESVRMLKGPARPLVPEEERAEVLAALTAVDYVVVFHDRTAERIVGVLRPDLYFKGADYSLDPAVLPEAAVVHAHGGKVRLLQFHRGRSTTALLARIKAVL